MVKRENRRARYTPQAVYGRALENAKKNGRHIGESDAGRLIGTMTCVTAPSRTFCCEHCQAPLVWQAKQVGESIRCSCGETVIVPDHPDPRVYELTEDAELKPVAPAPTVAAPVLPYHSAPAEKREQYDFLIGSPVRDFWVPIAMIVVATGLYFGRGSYLLGWPEGAVSASVQMLANILVVAITVTVLHRLTEMDLGPPGGTALRLVAIALLPHSVSGWMLLGLGCFGWPLAMAADALLYGTLFMTLLDLDLSEAALCTLVVWLLSAGSWFLIEGIFRETFFFKCAGF